MTRALSVLAPVLALAASQGAAATICVAPPTVTTCPNHTIQGAVDIANAGDIVQIAAGTYFEAVTVPSGKDNLQIKGAGALTTIIDHDYPQPAGSIGIHVNGSNGIAISNLGVQNGTGWGIAIGGNDAVISRVRVVGVHDNDGGILMNGTGNQVVFSEVRACKFDGIVVNGDNSVVKSNTVAQIVRRGISVLGNQSQVVGNRVTSAGYLGPDWGLYVNGTQNVVTSNILENIGSGINSVGLGVFNDDEPTVQGNKLIWSGEARIYCQNCNGGKVSLNSILGSPGEGFNLGYFPSISPAALLLVQGNKAAETARRPFQILGPTGMSPGTGMQVVQNSATDSGYTWPCFAVFGSGHTLTSNIAQKCANAGFRSNGDDLLFATNQAIGAATSGFVVDGYNNGNPAHFGATLNGNKASGSAGQGFALYDSASGVDTPVGTTGTGNTGLLNRQDFCNEGVAVTIGTFATSSTTCDNKD